MLRWLFDDGPFVPRTGCAISGDFPEALKWVLVAGDLGVWLCYLLIPAALLVVWRREHARAEAAGGALEIPAAVRDMGPWFMAFIFACGASHGLNATMFWWPRYRLLGVAVALTFVASAGTLLKLSAALVVYLRASSDRAAAEKRIAAAEARAEREAERSRRIEEELAAARAATEELKTKFRSFCLDRQREE